MDSYAPLLRRHNCTFYADDARQRGLFHVRQGHPCPETAGPEPLGIIQIYDRDLLDGIIGFKVEGVIEERLELGVRHHESFKTFEDLFTNASDTCKKVPRLV